MANSDYYKANPAKSIEQLFEDYGQVWPPRGDFADWPASWQPYMEMGEELPYVLHKYEDPRLTRKWMEDSLSKVDIESVMEDIERHLVKSDQKLIGLSACLSYMKSGYRWGTLPVQKEEKDRTTMVFPDNLVRPFHAIMALHGTSTHSNFFTLFYANSVYDEQNEPASVKFSFNVEPDVYAMEEEFFVKTVKMEVRFKMFLESAHDFLELTEKAKQSRALALETLAQRLEILDSMKESLTKTLKEFIIFTMWPEKKRHYWTRFIESMMAWNLDGENGTSGAETIIANFVDAFFHVPGRSFVYNAKPENYGRMAESIVNVLKAVSLDDPAERFQTFLDDGDFNIENDTIYQQRAAILRLFHMWRLSHSTIAGRIIASSEGLASGLDNDITGGTTLADSVKGALRERAQETKEAYNKDCAVINKDNQEEKDPHSDGKRSPWAQFYIPVFLVEFLRNIW